MWLMLSLIPQFKYMNRNDTAVREEMVHLANLIDSVSRHQHTCYANRPAKANA